MTGGHRTFSRDQRTTIVYGMLAFVLIIVLLTTGMQSLKAALKNPVSALRVE